MDPGAFISLNSDDDDDNGVADYLDTGTVEGEDDLVEMELDLSSIDSGTVTLSIATGADKVNVWLDAQKSGLGPILSGSVTQKTWDLGQQPGTVYVEAIAGSLVMADISFTLAAGPPSTQPATDTAKGAVVAGTIGPDDNQQGVTGGAVPSVKQQGMILKHYVSPKAAGSAVVLEAGVLPGVNFDDVYVWEGGEAVAGSPEKRSVSRAAQGRFEVKLKDKATGNVLDTMVVWVVWATSQTTVDGVNNTVGQTTTRINVTGEQTIHTITPGEILMAADRPDLSGANGIAPPNVPGAEGNVMNKGDDLSQGANKKWDASRQIRQKLVNPNNINFNFPRYQFPDGDLAFASYEDWPAEAATGNDDAQPLDEDNDPYSDPDKGKLTAVDTPAEFIYHQDGAVGDTVEIRAQFREFARLEIEGKWYRISDFSEWRVTFKWKKVDEVVANVDYNNDADKTDKLWIDDASSAAADHAGW